MTDLQLKLLLQSMLSELEYAVENTRYLMPEDAPREQVEEWKLKDGIKPYTLASAIDSNYYQEITSGDFEAIAPLATLIDKWQTRINQLVPDQENSKE